MVGKVEEVREVGVCANAKIDEVRDVTAGKIDETNTKIDMLMNMVAELAARGGQAPVVEKKSPSPRTCSDWKKD